MKTLKSIVRQKNHPKGSMREGVLGLKIIVLFWKNAHEVETHRKTYLE
jgi:hypothetical protein